MTEHRCDKSILQQTDHNPLTISRALRLLIASLEDTTDTRTAATPVLVDLGGCKDCLSLTLVSVAGMAAAALMLDAMTREQSLDRLNTQLAQLLDELDQADS